MAKCERCGQETFDGAAFCPNCGAPLKQPEANPFEGGGFYGSPSGMNRDGFSSTNANSGYGSAQQSGFAGGAYSQSAYNPGAAYSQNGYNPGAAYSQNGYDPNAGYGQPNYDPNAGYGQPNYNYAPPQGQVGQKSKIAAGILAILLGSLGIHKFYLGYTSTGIIMLLVTLLTFGLGAVVMAVISLVEGIIYLTKSDYEFYQTYELGQKRWF